MNPTDDPRYPHESIDKVSKQFLEILQDAIQTDPKMQTLAEVLSFIQVAVLRIAAMIIAKVATETEETPEVVRDRLIDAIKEIRFEAIH